MKDIVIRLNTYQDMLIKFHINQIVGFTCEKDNFYVEIAFDCREPYGTRDSIKIPINAKTLVGLRRRLNQ